MKTFCRLLSITSSYVSGILNFSLSYRIEKWNLSFVSGYNVCGRNFK